MQGLHLIADLYGCQATLGVLTDAARLGAACLELVRQAGLQPVGQVFHTFPAPTDAAGRVLGPAGVTATVLLAESHLCVHTWPERASVTLDIYVCNLSADHSPKARLVLDGLIDLFQPSSCQQQAITRGQESPA